MSTYAIGDIHGCRTAFETLLGAFDFSSEDKIIFLGDYVDRGPDTKGCIDRILELKQQYDIVTLRGNHEVMMLGARESPGAAQNWMSVGGREALDSYGAAKPEEIPEEHWRFIEKTIPYHETETHFFVHAGVDPDVPLRSQSDWDLYWSFFDSPQPHYSGKTMVCGHTSQKSGVPLSYGHAICIDTWVYGSGWLTCLEVETNRFTQANQSGKLRGDVLQVSELD